MRFRDLLCKILKWGKCRVYIQNMIKAWHWTHSLIALRWSMALELIKQTPWSSPLVAWRRFCMPLTWTEWSMTRSTGHSGLIFWGSPPRVCTASLIAAKSTTAGTPVKSWNNKQWLSLRGMGSKVKTSNDHHCEAKEVKSWSNKPGPGLSMHWDGKFLAAKCTAPVSLVFYINILHCRTS